MHGSNVRSLGLGSAAGWLALCKSGALPADIPSNPNKKYADEGWQGYGDWLGTEELATLNAPPSRAPR